MLSKWIRELDEFAYIVRENVREGERHPIIVNALSTCVRGKARANP